MRTSNENQKRYSEHDKDEARQTDIVDFLISYEGYTFKKVGKYMRCNEHDSLMIYPDRKGWFWNSIDTGGANALDYLQKIYYMDFPCAMATLVGEPDSLQEFQGKRINIPKFKQKYQNNNLKPVKETIPEQVFLLPEAASGQYTRVFAYLSKTRLIDTKIISELMHEKKIYQDNRGNVVYVGFNKGGEAKYAATRGTLSEVQYRGDVAGSDKSYGFFMNGNEKNSVYVFESPIDAMSHATLANLILGDSESWKKHNRLSLGCVSDNALERYLDDNPGIKNIIFCLDNDVNGKARDGSSCNHGQEAVKKYMVKYAEKGYNVRNRPPRNKDYNEDLIEILGIRTANKDKTFLAENINKHDNKKNVLTR